MRERLSDYQVEYEGELYQSGGYSGRVYQLIVWQSMTESAGRISVQPEAEVILHIIQTVPTFRWNIQQIFLMHWIFRMNYRHCILQVLYSMHLSVRSFLTGRLQLRWFVRLLRIISFRITQFLLHIPVCKEHGYISRRAFYLSEVW